MVAGQLSLVSSELIDLSSLITSALVTPVVAVASSEVAGTGQL